VFKDIFVRDGLTAYSAMSERKTPVKEKPVKTAFYKSVVRAITEAGAELIRRNTSHDIYRAPQRGNIVVPRKLDDPRVAHAIVKKAGAHL